VKKKFYSISVFIVFTLLVIVISACSAAAPAPVPPTIAPAAPSATVMRSLATATQPSAATAQPTAAATLPAATAAQPIAVKPELQGIVAAFAKTKTASAFKVSEKLSGNGTIVQFSPNMPTSVVLDGADGEFKGKDYHVKLSGLAGMLLSDDPTKGIEVTQVGGKTYVHGPASALNAPKDDWYLLGLNSGFTMNVSVPDQLDSLVAANGDWSRFQKSRNETFDGKKCDVYSAGKEAADATIETVSKPMLTALVADSGSVEMWICDDGYLHLLNASIQAHDQTTPSKTGKIEMAFHIFEQDGNIAIAAPANALAAVNTSGAAPTAAPIPTQPAASSGQGAPAGYDGDWNGTTNTADTPISFTVENNQVTFVNLSYSVQSGGCSLSGSLSKTLKVSIAGKSFTAQFTNDDGKQYLFAGTFASGKDATGTIEVKGTTTICGIFDAKADWTAKNAPADAQPTPSASTGSPQPGGATSSLDSMDVLLGFFDAINANDLDTAMTLVQDDVIMTAGSTTIIGKADLKAYLQKQAAQNVTYTASNLDSTGDIVNFTLQAGDNAPAVDGDIAIMVDGKLQTLTLH
jgi:hypothetical protein